MENTVWRGLILAAFAVWCALASKQPQMVYLKYVKCNVSSAFVPGNYSCFAKSYNRSFSAGTVLMTFQAPLKSFFLEIALQFKYGIIYREAFRVKRFDWCEAMAKKPAMNILTKFFVDILEESVPVMIHPCPYSGFNIDTISVKTSTMPSVFPSGDYKATFFLSDASGNPIATVFVVASMNSTNKDTFG